MREFLLNVYKRVDVWLNREQAISCPVAECKVGLPVVLPRRPSTYWTKRGKYKSGYLKAYCGFDIETTNVIKEDRKRAYMYIWQMSICTDKEGVIYLGRTWDDFKHLLHAIAKEWHTSDMEKLIVWDANLGFEFQFFRKLLKWSDDEYSFFAKEERKPLLCTTVTGIQFRECLSISGGSLGQLAKDYTITQKLIGDLDYKVQRNSKTKLTDTERDYCINDVVILAEWSKYIFEAFIIPFKRVPLTKTGLLRREVKERLKAICGDYKAYERMMELLYPSEETYIFWFRYLFRGGYVHSNYLLTNRILTDVLMYDITSSYPARMNMSYYPISAFKEVNSGNLEELLKTRCCIMIVTFYGIRNRGTHSIESVSKCIDIKGERLDNGRVMRAEEMTVCINELDYESYTRFYTWERMHIRRMWSAERGILPRFIRDVLNNHYEAKSRLKAAGLKDTSEYVISKQGVNSAYGLMVTKMQLDRVVYSEDGWGVADVPLDFEDEAGKQFLLPQWGIWVAAHARHEVLTMIYNITQTCGNIVIYCDTDSVKCLNHPGVEDVINAYNKQIAADLKRVGLAGRAGFEDLGMFDFEGRADRFKTLGAKRYMVDMGGKIIATIAGFPKSAIKRIDGDPFEAFNVLGMAISPEDSGKLTTAYIDEPSEDCIEGEWMHEESSVCLYEIPFSMMTDRDYYQLLIDSQSKRSGLGTRTNG